MRIGLLVFFGFLSLILTPHTAPARDLMPSWTPLPGTTITPQATDELFVGYGKANPCSLRIGTAANLARAPGTQDCRCFNRYGGVVPCNPYLNYFLRPSDLSQTNGRLPIFIPITQFFWNEDWQATWESAGSNGPFFDTTTGLLTGNAAQVLIDKNLLPSTATLTMRVYDVDSDIDCANGPPCYTKPEVDHIYVNGFLVVDSICGRAPILAKLTGTNDRWSIVSFQVPIQFLKFPLAPGELGDPELGTSTGPVPAINLVEIEVGLGDTDLCWGMGCNWATIDTRFLTQHKETQDAALARSFRQASEGQSGVPTEKVVPIVLQHGWNATGSGSWHKWAKYQPFPGVPYPAWPPGWLDDNGLRYVKILGGGLESIAHEAGKVVKYAKALAYKYYGNKIGDVAVIAHSKGGLDTRLAIQSLGRFGMIDKLVQLNSPNMGSHWMGLASGFATWGSSAANQLRPRWLNRHFNYTRTKGKHWYNNACYSKAYFEDGYYQYGTVRQTGFVPTRYYRIYGTSDLAVAEEKALFPFQVRTWNQQYHNDRGSGNDWNCVEPQAQYFWWHNGDERVWEGAARAPSLGHSSVHDDISVYKYAINRISPGFFPPFAGDIVRDVGKGTYDARSIAVFNETPPPEFPDIDYALFHGYDPDTTQTLFKDMQSYSNGTPRSDSFLLGRADTLGVTFFTEGDPDLDMLTSLTDPNGVTISPGNLASYPGATYMKILPEAATAGQNIVVYKVPRPLDGTWLATAQSTGGRSIVTSANVSSHYLFLTQTSQDTYSTFEPIDVLAKFQHERSEALLGATVTATIRLSDGVTETAISLLDDGAHGDEAANDGIYGNQFPSQAIEGRADIKIQGQWQDVVRIAFEDVAIVGNYASIDSCYGFAGNTSPVANDSDGDGLFNTLEFPIPVSVSKVGHYELGASLFAGDSLIDRQVYSTVANGNGPWPTGNRIVDLSFDGGIIAARGLNGPYRLGNVQLNYFLGDSLNDTVVLQQFNCICGTTATITDASLFQRPRISIPGPNSDVGVDTDADTRWNRLDVTLGVNVTLAGDYNVDAELYDACGAGHLVSGANTVVTLASGINSVPLQFDGSKIAAHGVNGPYKLKRVWVNWIPPTTSADSVSGMFGDVHTTSETSPYSASSFQGSAVSGSVVTYGTNQPVPNATISYYWLSPYYLDCFKWVQVATISNGSGTFNTLGLPPGTYQFSATVPAQQAAGAMRRSGELGAVSDTITVTVPPDTTITLRASVVTGVEGVVGAPRVLTFGPFTPNPAHSDLGIRFGLPRVASVSIKIFDIHGRLVRQLRRGVEPAGYHQTKWDGRSSGGEQVASGVYFLRLEVGDRTLNGRVVMLK